MIRPLRLSAVVVFLCFSAILRADSWINPTPAELSLTAIPEVPGASAVYLFREQTTDDALHMFSYYVRLKVLNERGKEYANVELPYVTGNGGLHIDNIAGRTIHADGTIIPFTGKPYDKLIEKTQGTKVQAKVFTLPDVEVGSIVEYRYKLRFDDNYLLSPDWYVQSELFTRKAHYMWRPTSQLVVSEDGHQSSHSVAWTPILPAGAQVKQSVNHAARNGSGDEIQLDLDVHDIPPVPTEQFMPPLNSISYRVLFYYTPYSTAAEYWKSEGKRWSKDRDKFIGPNAAVASAVASLVQPSDTQEQKLRKIYEAVMALENTDFTRQHSRTEDKALGLKAVTSTDDVISRKRGTSDQLARLFVAMARAAGMKAYLMAVANRDQRIFVPNYLNLGQLDDDIAVVPVEGKEMFFDPGQRFCSFGHLAWKHSLSAGLRQTDNGTAIVATPGEGYKTAHVSRVADLSLDETGVAAGTVMVTYTGDPALHWRHVALSGDDTETNTELRTSMERLLPGGMEVRVTDIKNLADGEKPLVITYAVKGAIGSPTAKRLLINANLFEVNSKPIFPEAKRDLPVDMRYPSYIQDAVRIKFPDSLAIESAPAPEEAQLEKMAVFSVSSKRSPNAITFFRNVSLGSPLFFAKEYPDLRAFYNKLEAKDGESLVLTRATAVAKSAPESN